MFGEYKLMAYIIIALAVTAFCTTAVLSYNHAVAKAATQAEQIKAQAEQIQVAHQIIDSQIQRQVELKKYSQDADQRNVASETRIKRILTTRSVRDGKGNISPNDPILAGLNGMYPGSEAVAENSTSGNSPGTAVPKKPDAASKVASGKDVLPE